MGIAFKTLIVTLMAYFVLMSLTVERAYCNAPLEPSSTVPFVPEAVAFCAKANPLFLQRPEWLRLATCFSAYGLCPFYLLIGATALLDAWVRMRGLILLFLGGKVIEALIACQPKATLAPSLAVALPLPLAVALPLATARTLISSTPSPSTMPWSSPRPRRRPTSRCIGGRRY